LRTYYIKSLEVLSKFEYEKDSFHKVLKATRDNQYHIKLGLDSKSDLKDFQMILIGIFNEESVTNETIKKVHFSLSNSFIAELPTNFKIYGRVENEEGSYMVYETKINEKVETIDILVTPCVGTVSIFIGSSFNHIINDLYLGQSEMKDRK
jgi:hypothetical protein